MSAAQAYIKVCDSKVSSLQKLYDFIDYLNEAKKS